MTGAGSGGIWTPLTDEWFWSGERASLDVILKILEMLLLFEVPPAPTTLPEPAEPHPAHLLSEVSDVEILCLD